MKKSLPFVFMAFFTFAALFSNAQHGDTLEIQRGQNGSISFVRFQPSEERALQNGLNFLKAVLNAQPDDQFRLQKEIRDEFGFTHLRFQQYYKSIIVENAEYLLHGKAGKIETINGDYQKVNITSITPRLQENQAIEKALSFVGAEKYKWQDEKMEAFIKKRMGDNKASYYPKGELVITRDYLKGGNNLLLAWKFAISSMQPSNEQLVYVDAITGDVIRVTPLILDTNTPCIAGTRYSGALNITGDSFAGGFRLRELRNGVDVQTLNLNNTYNYGVAIDFTNTNTNFTNGSWTDFADDQVALDAHWAAENVLDYFRTVHNRNSIDGSGIRVLNYIHAGSNWNNAQWVGGTGNRFMQYGDGDGSIFNPLTSLDVCAHEFGHGVNEFTAGLSPGTQESGALNEGFSDIWGACIERWAAPVKQTWLLGEEIMASAFFSSLRNMQNPNDNTAAEGQHPDTYLGTFWRTDGEPHNNSTVLSHWFFLLSQGGAGTNDISNAFSVTGIGINNAERIAYRALSVYLNSSANYTAARNATVQAAIDLYGANSCQVIAVTNAWFAVGIGSAYSGNGGLAISGDDAFCTTSNIYSIANLPTGATVEWQISPSIATINSPNSPQTTLAKTGNGTATLTAIVSNVCGTQITISKPNIVVGSPGIYSGFYTYTNYPYGSPMGMVESVDLTYDNIVCYTVRPTTATTMMDIRGASNVVWTKTFSSPTVFLWGQSGNNLTIDFRGVNQKGLFKLSASNSCGTTEKLYGFQSVSCGQMYFSVSPNPATNVVSISANGNTDGSSSKSAYETFDEVRIYDMQGGIKKYQKYSKVNLATINISGLDHGLYIIEITTGDYKERQQLLIQK